MIQLHRTSTTTVKIPKTITAARQKAKKEEAEKENVMINISTKLRRRLTTSKEDLRQLKKMG